LWECGPCPILARFTLAFALKLRKKHGKPSFRVGKPERKRPLGRPRSRWEDNIKIDLQEVGWEGMDWIDLA